MDRFDKFTDRARKVLTLAQDEAQRFNHNYIGTEHLLLGLVREGEGVAARVLENMNVELAKVQQGAGVVGFQFDRACERDLGVGAPLVAFIGQAEIEVRLEDVAVDRDGKTVWATDRCSPGTVPGCLGSNANPVHHFDENGKEIGEEREHAHAAVARRVPVERHAILRVERCQAITRDRASCRDVTHGVVVHPALVAARADGGPRAG